MNYTRLMAFLKAISNLTYYTFCIIIVDYLVLLKITGQGCLKIFENKNDASAHMVTLFEDINKPDDIWML